MGRKLGGHGSEHGQSTNAGVEDADAGKAHFASLANISISLAV